MYPRNGRGAPYGHSGYQDSARPLDARPPLSSGYGVRPETYREAYREAPTTEPYRRDYSTQPQPQMKTVIEYNNTSIARPRYPGGDQILAPVDRRTSGPIPGEPSRSFPYERAGHGFPEGPKEPTYRSSPNPIEQRSLPGRSYEAQTRETPPVPSYPYDTNGKYESAIQKGPGAASFASQERDSYASRYVDRHEKSLDTDHRLMPPSTHDSAYSQLSASDLGDKIANFLSSKGGILPEKNLADIVANARGINPSNIDREQDAIFSKYTRGEPNVSDVPVFQSKPSADWGGRTSATSHLDQPDSWRSPPSSTKYQNEDSNYNSVRSYRGQDGDQFTGKLGDQNPAAEDQDFRLPVFSTQSQGWPDKQKTKSEHERERPTDGRHSPLPQALKEDKYGTCIYLGMEDAPDEFCAVQKILGSDNENLEYVRQATGATVELRGEGTRRAPNKPLHIYIGHSSLPDMQEAEKLATSLVTIVHEEYSDWKTSVQRNQKERFREPVNRSSREADMYRHDTSLESTDFQHEPAMRKNPPTAYPPLSPPEYNPTPIREPVKPEVNLSKQEIMPIGILPDDDLRLILHQKKREQELEKLVSKEMSVLAAKTKVSVQGNKRYVEDVDSHKNSMGSMAEQRPHDEKTSSKTSTPREHSRSVSRDRMRRRSRSVDRIGRNKSKSRSPVHSGRNRSRSHSPPAKSRSSKDTRETRRSRSRERKLPASQKRTSHEKESKRNRSKSRDRKRSRSRERNKSRRSRSRSKERRGRRSKSAERHTKRGRSKSSERHTRRGRSKSAERHKKRGRSKSAERHTKRGRSKSAERHTKRGRSKSAERHTKRGRSRERRDERHHGGKDKHEGRAKSKDRKHGRESERKESSQVHSNRRESSKEKSESDSNYYSGKSSTSKNERKPSPEKANHSYDKETLNYPDDSPKDDLSYIYGESELLDDIPMNSSTKYSALNELGPECGSADNEIPGLGNPMDFAESSMDGENNKRYRRDSHQDDHHQSSDVHHGGMRPDIDYRRDREGTAANFSRPYMEAGTTTNLTQPYKEEGQNRQQQPVVNLKPLRERKFAEAAETKNYLMMTLKCDGGEDEDLFREMEEQQVPSEGLVGEELDDAVRNRKWGEMPDVCVSGQEPGLPGASIIWVLGDTQVYLAAQATESYARGPNMGLPNVQVHWIGRPGLVISEVDGAIAEYLTKLPIPDCLIVHAGTEDMTSNARAEELKQVIEHMLLGLRATLPEARIFWSEILEQMAEEPSADVKVAMMRSYANEVAWNVTCNRMQGAGIVEHEALINLTNEEYYRGNGVYVNDKGAYLIMMNMRLAMTFHLNALRARSMTYH